MVFLNTPSVPATPAWVDECFFLHDTLKPLPDAVLLEAEFPGSAGSQSKARRAAALGEDRQMPASVGQHV